MDDVVDQTTSPRTTNEKTQPLPPTRIKLQSLPFIADLRPSTLLGYLVSCGPSQLPSAYLSIIDSCPGSGPSSILGSSPGSGPVSGINLKSGPGSVSKSVSGSGPGYGPGSALNSGSISDSESFVKIYIDLLTVLKMSGRERSGSVSGASGSASGSGSGLLFPSVAAMYINKFSGEWFLFLYSSSSSFFPLYFNLILCDLIYYILIFFHLFISFPFTIMFS